MTTRTLRVAPAYSMIFISDPAADFPPAQFEDVAVRANEAFVTIRCQMAQFGDTDVSVIETGDDVPSRTPVLDTVIMTPSKTVSVTDAELMPIAESSVSSGRTRIRVWTNRSLEPDQISIAIG